MSVINRALSELSKKDPSISIEAAVVPSVKTRSPWVWVAAGFAISLTVGGWAISQSPKVGYTSAVSEVTEVEPTQSRTIESAVTVAKVEQNEFVQPKPKPIKPKPQEDTIVSHVASPVLIAAKLEEPVNEKVIPSSQAKKSGQSALTHSVKTHSTETHSAETQSSADPLVDTQSIIIQQVELTPTQLADNAVGRAKKSLDENDLPTALANYTEALRYTPRNEDVRQKLAILYFGKGDSRKAYDLLQSGIRLNVDSEDLRLGLSKLLIKANQSEAALSPLVHLPPKPSKDYLSMRAALSQKAQQEKIALESYQKLVALDGENARWWLGLGIQQERQLDFFEAQNSYNQALIRVGISSQSQSFVRDRLRILKELEETTSAN